MNIPVPERYEHLDDAALRRWLTARPELYSRVRGKPDEWQVDNVSNDTLDVVYVVKGPAGGVCVKQPLPGAPSNAEEVPPLERAYFEQLYLQASGSYVQGLAPALLHYDPDRLVIATELLDDHMVLRRGLIAGQRYPTAARRVAEYIARRAFATSVLAEPFERVNDRMAAFSRNQAHTRITVSLMFTRPYVANERYPWTAPHLNHAISALRTDSETKAAVARLGHRFLTVHEALLHGNLHTGSVMVTANDTRVINPNFATYGPIGFDLGLFVGNLLLTYFSQFGYEQGTGERRDYGEWILEQIGEFWNEFAVKFETMWLAQRAGDGYPTSLVSNQSDAESFALARKQWLGSVFADMLGYAGVEIVRRIAGFVHKLDFAYIIDANIRYALELRALEFARQLITRPETVLTPPRLLGEARKHAEWPDSR